jgi:K+-sensing histidine kinase KdpD
MNGILINNTTTGRRPDMKKLRSALTIKLLFNCIFAIFAVAITTFPLVRIGRDTLGEAVIALLYLIPVGWSAARWGQVPGLCAALAAALAFDFFFIPPFLTFTVGSLEGWLVLAIFLVVAIIVVGRIQKGMSRALASERDAHFMYELSITLAGLRTQETVIQVLARHLQGLFQAKLVEVTLTSGSQKAPLIAHAPAALTKNSKPDMVLPILASPGMVGEICIWRGNGWLPEENSLLLKNISQQAALSLERARLMEAETSTNSLPKA